MLVIPPDTAQHVSEASQQRLSALLKICTTSDGSRVKLHRADQARQQVRRRNSMEHLVNFQNTLWRFLIVKTDEPFNSIGFLPQSRSTEIARRNDQINAGKPALMKPPLYRYGIIEPRPVETRCELGFITHQHLTPCLKLKGILGAD